MTDSHIKIILDAIITRLQTDSTFYTTTLGSRVYFSHVPQDTPYPYMSIQYIGGIPDYTSTTKWEMGTWLFTIFSKGSNNDGSITQAEDLNYRLYELLDYHNVSLALASSWGLVRCIREYDSAEKIDEIWHYYSRYRIEIEKQR